MPPSPRSKPRKPRPKRGKKIRFFLDKKGKWHDAQTGKFTKPPVGAAPRRGAVVGDVGPPVTTRRRRSVSRPRRGPTTEVKFGPLYFQSQEVRDAYTRGISSVTIREAPSGRTGASFTTWFKALGTAGNIQDMTAGKSPDLISEDLVEFAAPAAFYSNQSGLLGQVVWKGIVTLSELIDRLNSALQFTGEETRGFDFRNVYRQWSYKYQVIEHIGPTKRVIEEVRDSS